MLLRSTRQAKRRGQALTEYALLLAGIFVICAVAVALLGDKVRDSIGVAAAILPSAHADDNLPIKGGELIPMKDDGTGTIVLDSAGLVGTTKDPLDRMAPALGSNGGAALVK